MLEKFSKEREILLYCDLHGHSRKKNSFIYGCNTTANGGFNSWTKVRLYPRVLARVTPVFNIQDCKFKVEKSKAGTARIVVWKEFKVTNSFTLENSFYGYDYGNLFVKDYSTDDLRELGMNLVNALDQYRLLLLDIQKDLNLTGGWLKPNLMRRVTGVPAAEVLRNDL